MAYAVVVSMDVAAKDVERLKTALLAHRDRCLANEPGTLQFDVLQPTEEEGKLMIYELYTDEAAFQAHAKGESSKTIRAETEGIDRTATLTCCTVL